MKSLIDFENYGGDVDEFIRKWGRSGNADVAIVLDSVRKNTSTSQFVVFLFLFLVLLLIGVIAVVKVIIPFTYIAL